MVERCPDRKDYLLSPLWQIMGKRPWKMFEDDVLDDLYWWGGVDYEPKKMNEVPAVEAFFGKEEIQKKILMLVDETLKDGLERGIVMCLDSDKEPFIVEEVVGEPESFTKRGPFGGCVSAAWHIHPITEKLKAETEYGGDDLDWWARPSATDFIDDMGDRYASTCITAVDMSKGREGMVTKCSIPSPGWGSLYILKQLWDAAEAGKSERSLNEIVEKAIKNTDIKFVHVDELSN